MVIVERLRVLSDEDIIHMLRNSQDEFKKAEQALRSAQFNVKYKEISYKLRRSEMYDMCEEFLRRKGYGLTVSDDKPIPDFTKSPY